MPFFALVTLLILAITLVDVIRKDESEIRYLPKFAWIIIPILLPLLGSALWWTIGREYPQRPSPMQRTMTRMRPTQPAPPARQAPQPADLRTTEQQIEDLDREIEEWRLREELARRRGDEADDAT